MPASDTAPDVRWTVHCDGTSQPNPGRMGLGAVFTAPDGARHTLSKATGTNGCNNEAEVRALIAALHELQRLGASEVRIYCDSSILVEQLGDAAAAPIVRLANIFEEARQLLHRFPVAEMRWVPRHRNIEADALARAALGLPSKAGMKVRPKKRYAR